MIGPDRSVPVMRLTTTRSTIGNRGVLEVSTTAGAWVPIAKINFADRQAIDWFTDVLLAACNVIGSRLDGTP
jgi:hypothetical protein